jgi:hypothetical protein
MQLSMNLNVRLRLLAACILTLAASACGATTAIAKQDVSLGLPMTTGWYYLPGGAHPEGYKTFRKYSMFATKNADGSLAVSNLLNTIMFNCSLTVGKPSYIDFVIPAAIKVNELIGSEHLENYPIHILFPDGQTYSTISTEIQDNEIFADLDGDNVDPISKILSSDRFVVLLDTNSGVSFTVDRTGSPTFDEVVKGSMMAQYKDATITSNSKVTKGCN